MSTTTFSLYVPNDNSSVFKEFSITSVSSPVLPSWEAALVTSLAVAILAAGSYIQAKTIAISRGNKVSTILFEWGLYKDL